MKICVIIFQISLRKKLIQSKNYFRKKLKFFFFTHYCPYLLLCFRSSLITCRSSTNFHLHTYIFEIFKIIITFYYNHAHPRKQHSNNLFRYINLIARLFFLLRIISSNKLEHLYVDRDL